MPALQVDSVKRLDGLPALKKICDRLGLIQLVNDHVPVANQALLSHGEAFLALVLNKLHAPTPLYHVQEWAQEIACERLLGVKPETLNDDRLGRMLEAVAENIEPLKAAICYAAIDAFGLDVGRLHWDLTSLSFFGAYEDQDEEFAELHFGNSSSKDGKNKLQYRVAHLVCGDGAVGGLIHQTFSGNESDQNSIETQFPLLRELARRYGTTPRVVGDSKLVSHEVMVKFEESGLEFLSPEPSSKELKELYRRFGKDPTANWVELDYVSESASQKRGEIPVYKGLELEFEYELVEQKGQVYRKGAPVQQAPKPQGGRPPKAKRVYKFRRILIFSSTNQMAQRKNRERYFSRLENSFEQLNEKFRTPWWINKTRQRAQQAVNKLLKSSKLGHLYRCELTRNPDDYWELEWTFDEVAHSDLESLDGFYSLATNIPKEAENLSKTFRDYKKQIDSERRFADWKGPLHVCSVFFEEQ